MIQVIAVFDIGKTNKKLLLFDNSFKVVYQEEQKFPVIVDEDGFECDDIDLITSWIAKRLEELIIRGEYELVAVNFSTYGASLMFLDESGNRLTPVYNYLKDVPSSISENLFAEYGGKDEFCRKTASPALGMLLNSGIQMLWLQREKPEVFKKVRSILHFPQYLSYKLTGEIVSEPTSIGCHTFMWDFDRMNYHRWISDKGFALPVPITNDIVFPAVIHGQQIKVGTGIHDSSASLAPYLKGSSAGFILVSTGTWCISMNPFNKEPLTAAQLEKDCLCYLSPDKAQVKSSRLFMGHFHEVWAEKLAQLYKVDAGSYKSVKMDDALISRILAKFPDPVYFPAGKESFEDGLQNADLSVFESYTEAYAKLVIDLTVLCVEAIQLVIPENDETELLYISGGFARNSTFVELLKRHFPGKKVLISEIDNSSALGAALVISGAFSEVNQVKPDL
ncbi:MAG TPA: FGGY family carbohydrate kinase, partial [Prolixibacteraceae bacterium]|nr:FGGY family carbohydrate kinase [Prolixibacteraceae bacterium]